MAYEDFTGELDASSGGYIEFTGELDGETPRARRDVPDATAGSVARDIAAGALQIGPTAVKGVADIARLATGDRVGKDTSEAMERGMASIRDTVGSERAAAQRENFQRDMADDGVGIGEALMRDKGALADQLLPTVGSMFLPVGVAGAAGKLATAGKAAQALPAADVAARVLAVQKAAGIGATAAQNAASTFAELVDKGTSLEDAYLGAGITVPFSVVAGALTGGGAEVAAARALSGSPLAKTGAAQLVKGAGKEGAQEMGEELGQIAGEAGATGILPSATGAGKQLAVAGTLGAAMGGGVDVATQAQALRQPRPAVQDAAQDAAAATQTPGQDQAPSHTSQAPAAIENVADRAPPDQQPDGTPATMDDATAAARLAELEVIDSSVGLSPAQQAERDALATRVEALAAREAELEAIGESTIPVETAAEAAAETTLNAVPALDGQAQSAINSDEETTVDHFEPGAVQAKTWPQFVLERGERVSTLRKGTPAWDQLQSEWAAVKTARAGTNPEGTGAAGVAAPEIQNRDRSRPASVVQMQAMAQDPDYMRLGVSRSPETGAPMVFAVGDQAQAARALGRADTAVMSDGQRVPFQYAVMEAADVQPSNFADGGVNPLFDAAHPGTVKALNNGRTAGLRAAYERGTAGRYRRELAGDAALHGIDPEVIAGMQAPMLVRLYSERDNQTNMGAKSQSQALGLSATEQAATDAALVDGSVLDVFEAGGLDSAANRDFARAFIGRLQAQGQDVAGMLDAGGALSPAGVTRLQAALVHKAYGDGDLVESLFGSTDNDIRAIGEALKEVAGEWANMRHAAAGRAVNPQVDVTGNLLQAIRMVQKARRERASLYDAIHQVDMVTGDVPDAITVGVLRLLYSGEYLTRAVGRERLAEALREYLGAALATRAEGDMFGEQVGPDAILSALSGQPATETQHAASTPTARQPDPTAAQGERRAAGSDAAGGRAAEPGSQARRPQPGPAGPDADEAGRGGQGQDAQDPERQPDGQGDQGTGQDGRGAVDAEAAPELQLTGQTPEQLREQTRQQEEAQAQAAREQREVEQRAQADAEQGSFALTGSDRPADVLEAQGQQPMFSRAGAPLNTGSFPPQLAGLPDEQERGASLSEPLFSRSADTRATYEGRIDALFDGDRAKVGTRILDASEVMGLLGYPRVPLMLNESHLRDGLGNHPEMTAAVWKKVPGWIENPAAVYTDPRDTGRLIVLAPETLAGYPVMMVIEPKPTPTARGSAEPFQLLVTAYAKTTGGLPAAGFLASSGHLKYVHTQNAPGIWQSAGVQFPRQSALSQGRSRILTEKHLGGYRRANDPAFSFAGEQAATADRHALASARQRLNAGEDAEAVRQDTGWHKGADGKWRFEINDANASYIGKQALEAAAEADPYRSVELPLEEVLNHPALFAAYPALRQVQVFYEASSAANGDMHHGASYNARENVITMGNGLSEAEQLSALLHEVQHGIQDVEGFATGTSIEAQTDASEFSEENRKHMQQLVNVDQLARENKVKPENFVELAGFPANVINTVKRWTQAGQWESNIAAVKRDLLTAREKYRRSAGEVEARNTQARQKLTDEQRRATPPSSTADVADANVIVTFNGKEMASAPMPANAGGFDFAAMRRAVLGDAPGAAAPARAQAVAAVRQAVDAIRGTWAEAPPVHVVFDMRDPAIPQAARDANAAQKAGGAQGEPEGFFHAGQVYLLASQLPTARDATRVLFHEVLGHHGLRGVFGDRLDGVLDQLAQARPAEVRAKLADYGLPDTRAGRRTAAEEVLAEMAQARPELGFVHRAVAAVRNWLRERVPGFAAMRMTDADIIQAFILPARGWVERGRQATGEPATSSPTPAFSRGAQQGGGPSEGRLTQLQRRAGELLGYRSVDDALYAWQDKFIDLKRIQSRIKALNGVVNETNDAYRGEELYHKRVAKRVSNFQRDEVAPLVRAMKAADVGKEELERFLHARHAPEANRVLAERNPSQATLDAERAKAGKRVANLRLQLQRAQAQGTAAAPVQKALAQALADKDRWDSAQAFQGAEEDRLALSGMSDAEAAQIMGSLTPERRQQLDALATRVDRINEGTLKTLEGYGLMDRAALAAWRKTYQHYVPLHRDEARPDSHAHPIGQGFSTKGDAAKRRTGSNERVTNILAHVLMQREAALTRGEKNNVVKRLYLLAAQNPDPELWSLDAPKKKAVDPDTGLVKTMVDQAALMRDNVVRVRIGGQDRFIVFNERSEQAARLALALKNLDAMELDRFTRLMGKLTRWFSAVNTQYNPVFGAVNIIRDVQAMLLQLSSTPLAGKQGEVLKNVAANLPEIYRDLRAQRQGAGPGQGPWARLWEQMQLDGGTTGYRELYTTPEDRVRALDKELAKLDQGNARAAAEGIVGWLSDYNEALENTTRLGVYKAALDQGLSRQEAASIAKNITVNFNRKGRNTAVMGSWFAFLNAAIQGTTRMAETLAGPAGRKVMIGGVTLGMLSAAAGMAMMGGGGADDEWKKIPEFVKERSVIIPLGRQDYLTIPMPLGFHVFPNIGRKMVEFATHDDPVKSRAGYLADLALIVLNAFNPLGGAENLMQMVTPTPFDPVVAVAMNKDWTGRAIEREKRTDSDPTPGHARAKDAASQPARWVARGINAATGGNEWREGAWSPTPDALDYLFGQLTGGVGRELVKAGKMAAAATTGEELAPHQIILAGRFYGNTRGANGQSQAFYENVKRINGDMAEAKGRVEAGEAADGVLRDVPLAPLEGAAKQVTKRLAELRKMRRQAQEQGGEDKIDQVKAINAEIEQSMYLLNQAVEEVLDERRRR